MKRVANIVQMHEQFPYKNTPVQLCFEAEIKRIADQRGEAMVDVVSKLAGLSGVTERQIYNYRAGKTELTPEQIKIFCEQFASIALGMAWLSTFGVEQEDFELYDLSRLASRTVRNVLNAGDEFLEAFEDNKIDGHEMNKLEFAAAKIHRDTVQLIEVARGHHNRRRAS